MNIKTLRKQLNKTQQDIANDLNISRQNYSRYESENVEPDIKTLKNLADYFNVSLDYLCGRTWNNNIGYIPEEKKEVIKIILQLNEINTIKILGFASGLLAGQN